jgi:hypothetical protein
MKYILKLSAIILIVFGIGILPSLSRRKGNGSVYCNKSCSIKIDYKICPVGTDLEPCGHGVQPYILIGGDPNKDCIPTGINTHFCGTN